MSGKIVPLLALLASAVLFLIPYGPFGSNASAYTHMDSSWCSGAGGSWDSSLSTCTLATSVTLRPGASLEIPTGATLISSNSFIQLYGLSCYPTYDYSPSPYLPPPIRIGSSCNSPAILQIDTGATLKLTGSSLLIYGSVLVQPSGILSTDTPGDISTLTNSSCTELNFCDPSQATGTLQSASGITPVSVVLSGTVSITTSNGATVCPLALEGSWSGTTCSVQSGFTVSAGATLDIGSGVTVNGGSFSSSQVQVGVWNHGTINNLGTLDGTCDTGGDCIGIQSNGRINNNGTMSGNGNGAGGINSNGDIYNFGIMSGPGNGIENYGNIFNYGTMTGVGYSGVSGIYNQADIYNYGTMSTPSGSVIRNFGSTGTIWNTGIMASGGGIVNDCAASGGVLNQCPTIFNDGTITSAALSGDGGYDIQSEGTINDYCGVTLSATLDTISSAPHAISCFNITFSQSGLPSSAPWGVTVLWVFGPIHYSATGPTLLVKLTNGPFGVINYAFESPVASSGATYSCSSGCTAFNVVLTSAKTFSATYLQQTATSVSCSPSSVDGTNPTTCRATVSGSSPTGTVTFTSSSASGTFSPSAKCTLSSGSCSVSYADPLTGTPTVTASYGGDGRNGPSSGTTSVTILTTVYYTVTFSVTGIPTSDLSSWGVSISGVEATQAHAGSASLTVQTLAYPQTYQFDSTISGGSAGLFFCSSGCSGTVSSTGTITATYVSGELLSQSSCTAAFGGTWSGSTCTTSSASIGSGQSLEIPTGVTFEITGLGSVTNNGQITVDQGAAITLDGGGYSDNGLGTQLTNTGTIINSGTIGIYSSATDHYLDGNDGIDNYGTITNTASGVINVENSGNGNGATTLGLYNLGTVLNSGTVNVENSADISGAGTGGPFNNQYGIYNSGTFTNQGCGALAGTGADSFGVTIPSGGCPLSTTGLSTQLSSSSIQVGGSATDTATLSGSTSPTGSVTFTVYSDSACTVSVFTSTAPVNGVSAGSASFSPSSVGTFYWAASYPGDPRNTPSASTCGPTGEVLTVVEASPVVTSTASLPSVTLGGSAPTLQDVVTLAGGFNPTGSITFTLTAPGGLTVDTETVTVSGDGAYSTLTGYTLPTSGTVTGTYQWHARYSGDSNNNPVSDQGGATEQDVVSPALTSIVTSASPSSSSLGGGPVTLDDTATLSGGYHPTGTLTFVLISPGNTIVDDEVVTVSGNGAYATAGYALPSSGSVTGTYQWAVQYSGDGNNVPATGPLGPEESAVVSPATTTASTACAPNSVAAGSSSTCTFTVSGFFGSVLGETATFSSSSAAGAFSPEASCTLSSGGSCSVTYLDTDSGAPLVTGSYPGDSNNLGSTGSFILANFAVPASSTATSEVPLSGGSAFVDQTSQTGVSTSISGSSGSSATIFSADLGTTHPAGTGVISLAGSQYYDVKVVGISTGTARVCITSTGLTSTDTIQYWDGSAWDTASGITITGSTMICGDIPVSALTGTNIAVGVVIAQPAITTTPSSSTLTLGSTQTTLTDTAVLSGGNDPSGTITFTLLGPGATAVDTETVAVSGNGLYATPAGYTLPTTGTVTGTYQWDASYSGDPFNYPASDSDAANEQVIVGPASPVIVTTSSTVSVTLGGSTVTLEDSATLSGGYDPSGTITFTLQAPGAGVVDTETVTVTGNGVYKTPVGFSLPHSGAVTGTYQWQAAYSGDANNNAAADIESLTEQTTVNAASPTIVTTPSPPSVSLGTTPHTLADSAVLSGGYGETGTLTFFLEAPGGQTVDTETLTVSGDGTYNTPAGFTIASGPGVTGTYQWTVQYSGDSNNRPATGSNVETVTVTQGVPTLTTTASQAFVTLGGSSPKLSDSATIAGGASPTGTLTFVLTAPGGSVVDTETVTVNGDGTYNTPVGFVLPNTGAVVGTYQWGASYSGDSSNVAVSDNGLVSEQTVVSSASPTLVTTPSPALVSLGITPRTLADSSTLSGGYYETGSITFSLEAPGGSIVDTETVSVGGDGTYATPVGFVISNVPGATGTYQWLVAYSGDANNNGAGGGNVEEVSVSIGLPTLTTSASPASVTLGGPSPTLADSASLTGGASPTGTLTFTLVSPTGAVVDTETVTVSGDAAYSTPVGFSLPTSGPVVGAYQWDVTYSGDANNVAVSDNNAPTEQSVVSAASPTIATTPSPGSAGLNAGALTLKDTAKLSGGYFETGTLTFTLRAPGGSVVDTENVAVSGDGSYSTPTGFKLPTTGLVAGTYQWGAAFSGDPNNNPVAENDAAAEQVPVMPASTSLTTALSASTLLAGYSASDSASLGGGFNPTGAVTFYYSTVNSCPSNGATQAGTPVPVGTTLESPQVAFPNYGTYYWYAVYSGDSNNLPSSSACEPLNVQDFALTTTPPTFSIVAGTSGSSTVSLSNLGGFTGAVSLAIASQPAGVTASLSGTSVSGSETATLTVSSSVAGTYLLTITGTATSGAGQTVQRPGYLSVVVSFKDCSSTLSDKGGKNLKGADLEYCNLAGYDLSGDNLESANLQFTNLRGANLGGANMKNADLAGTSAQGANFKGANLKDADLAGANAAGASFKGSNLKSANLHGATLTKADFRGADMGAADLSSASAEGSNFQKANLKGANLQNGDFTDGLFQGSNLDGSNMSYGNFSYANFTGASAKGANTTGAIFTGATNPP